MHGPCRAGDGTSPRWPPTWAPAAALVLSLRADHLGDLAPYPDIARVLEDGLYLLGPMSEPDLRSAIEGPARRAGLRLEPGLVDLLVREVEGEPAALPMLSHVLRETWERREGPTLTVDGYRATGGIRHAVSQSAETLYDAMDEAQRGRLRSLLLRLVMPTEDGDPVRARVPRAKVAADDAHARLVEQLVEARLVSIDGDTVQIAHEALVRVWPRLRGWLDDDVDGQRLFRHLAGAADAWEAMGRPGQRALPRSPAQPHPGVARPRDARPERHRDRVRRRLCRPVGGRATRRRGPDRPRALGQPPTPRRPGRVGVLLVLALVAGVVAVRTADQARTGPRPSARRAADLADARRAGAQALSHEDPAAAAARASPRSGSTPRRRPGRTSARRCSRNAVAGCGVRDAGGSVVDPWRRAPTERCWPRAWPGVGEGVQLLDAATLDPVAFEDDTREQRSRVLRRTAGSWRWRSTSGTADGSAEARRTLPIRLYDMPGGTRSRRQLGGFPAGSAVEYSLDFSGDGRRMVAAVDHLDTGTGEWDEETAATVWDLADPSKPVFRAKVPDYRILSLSPDGRRLYVALTGEDRDRPIRVYDVDSGRLVSSTRSDILDEIGAFAADLSPDGSTFAVATASEVSGMTRRPCASAVATSRPAPVTTSTGSSTPTTARCSPLPPEPATWSSGTPGPAPGFTASPRPGAPGGSRSRATTGPCSPRATGSCGRGT